MLHNPTMRTMATSAAALAILGFVGGLVFRCATANDGPRREPLAVVPSELTRELADSSEHQRELPRPSDAPAWGKASDSFDAPLTFIDLRHAIELYRKGETAEGDRLTRRLAARVDLV